MNIQFLNFSDIQRLKDRHPELVIHNRIDLAINELFDIEFPGKKDSKTEIEVKEYGQTVTNGDIDNWGEWVYFPWINTVVHLPSKQELRALRTSRNRNLITESEQDKLYDSTILVVGMSVGSNVVEALVSQGIGGKLILVDMDIIEPSNLNRIRAPFHHVGLHKVEAISRKIQEIDPYIEIIRYEEGLTEANLKDILEIHKVNVLVDEMDDLRMKILLREYAKGHRLPVIMAADDGDDALIDIERYDLQDNLDVFGGRIPQDILEEVKSGDIPRPELGSMIGRYFVGVENIPLRMFRSLAEVGKTLPSWPQLGGAATLSGLSIAYVVRKILLGEKLQQGRILVSLDEKLDLEKLSPEHQEELLRFQDLMSKE